MKTPENTRTQPVNLQHTAKLKQSNKSHDQQVEQLAEFLLCACLCLLGILAALTLV